MNNLTRCALRAWTTIALTIALGTAGAQTLPVKITTSGNVAIAQISTPQGLPLAEVTLSFDDASGLTASSVGIGAALVSPTDPGLLARLPKLTTIDPALSLLVTIEPPSSGGLSFRRTGRYELHTAALPYTTGSFYRVLKAPLGGSFRDTTEAVVAGSVRASSRYGGFSQFLVLLDLRPTKDVISEKVSYLRGRIAVLPSKEQPDFSTRLDAIESAISQRRYNDAIVGIDDFSARAIARAGKYIPDVWRATRDVDNQAGELIAGAATLKFSVAYLRDFGQ